MGLIAQLTFHRTVGKAINSEGAEQGASVATVNRECATLRRMLSIAVDAGKLSRRPKFDMLDGEKVRQGFVEHGDFCRLLGHLPDALKPAVEFLYYGGWRKSPVVTLNGKRLICTGGPRGSRPRTQKRRVMGVAAIRPPVGDCSSESQSAPARLSLCFSQ